MVNTVKEAKTASLAARYFPSSTRGGAAVNRATVFGAETESYFYQANENLLTVVQIETQQAVDNAQAIATIPGIDVLFVGSFDLSISLGLRDQYDHPTYLAALDHVVTAAKATSKAVGILLLQPNQVATTVNRGLTFLALGADGRLVANGMVRLVETFLSCRRNGE